MAAGLAGVSGRRAGRVAGRRAGRVAGRRASGVAGRRVLPSSAGSMLRAHLLPVLIREGAYALADAVRARRECVFAFLDLLNDLLPPVGGVDAAGDGGLRTRRTDGEYRDRETDGALGGHQSHRISKS
jgi:hypothetical protein